MSQIKVKIKSLIASAIYRYGLFNAKLAKLTKNNYIVLMYHRIVPLNEVGPYLQPGMYVEPHTFDSQLNFLKKHFDIRSANELCYGSKIVRQGISKPICYITFDDGWRDFYTYAYPILIKHGLPATVFLPTGFIGTEKIFWTDRFSNIFDAILRNNTLNDLKKALIANKILNKSCCYSATNTIFEDTINELKKRSEQQISIALNVFINQFNVDLTSACTTFLNWQQIAEMMTSGLISYGSHTETHRILTTLTSKEVEIELNRSKTILLRNKVISIDELMLCYPNGNFNNEIVDSAIKSQYQCAFSTKAGVNEYTTNNYEIKRIGIHQDMTKSDAMFAYRIYGAI